MKYKICLNLSTLGHLNYESQLKISSQVGFKAVGLRMNSLKEYLSSGHTLKEAKKLLEKNNLTPVEMNFFSDWLYAKDEAQKEVLEQFRVFSRISGTLGSPILIVTTQCKGDHDDHLARENFKEICRLAAEAKTMVALEFVPWSPVNTIQKAWKLVKSVDATNGGIALDSFHYFKGGSRKKDLSEVPIEKIFIVHLDDVINVKTDVITLSRNYRVFPGEGIFIFDEILEYLFDKEYKGFYSLEILNKYYPKKNPLKLAFRAKESILRLLDNFTKELCKNF